MIRVIRLLDAGFTSIIQINTCLPIFTYKKNLEVSGNSYDLPSRSISTAQDSELEMRTSSRTHGPGSPDECAPIQSRVSVLSAVCLATSGQRPKRGCWAVVEWCLSNGTDGGPRGEGCGCCGGPTRGWCRLLMATRCKVWRGVVRQEMPDNVK